jgi:hypothetical protein
MGLDYLILLHKPKIKLRDKNGNMQEAFDLLPQTMGSSIVNDDAMPCVVNKFYVGRPDLISLAFYGTDKYADLICKLNGISNPFEINENDLLSIPRLSDIMHYSNAVREPSDIITPSSSIVKSVESKQKELNKKRSPNEQVVGDKNFVIDKSLGLIFY